MRSIRSKITRAYIYVSLGFVVLLLLPLNFAIEEYFRNRLVAQLELETGVLATVLSSDNVGRSREHVLGMLGAIADSSGMRITLIDHSGRIQYESSVAESLWVNMENHIDRPEVREAISKGVGMGTRHSSTLDTDMVYVARVFATPGPAGSFTENLGFVRAGYTSGEINREIWRIRAMISFAGIFAFISIILVSRMVAKRISAPLTEISDIVRQIKAGDLNQALPVHENDEIGRLSELINEMTGKLRSDIEQLKRLERFRSEFLGNVSHELRTPIFSMKGFLETLLEGAIDDPKVNKSFVEKAYHHASRLDSLLRDLIEISRIESGDMKMSFRYFDVADFLSSLRDDFIHEAGRRGQQIVVESGPVEILAFGDKDRLRVAVGSMIDNAIKYSRQGAVITLRAVEDDGVIRISIEDDGPGIAAEHLPRIFERFYRVDKNRSREVGGTGLGLAIAKHIVEANGARIVVESDPGVRTVFSFELKK